MFSTPPRKNATIRLSLYVTSFPKDWKVDVPLQVHDTSLTRQPLTSTEPPLAHEASREADGRPHHIPLWKIPLTTRRTKHPQKSMALRRTMDRTLAESNLTNYAAICNHHSGRLPRITKRTYTRQPGCVAQPSQPTTRNHPPTKIRMTEYRVPPPPEGPPGNFPSKHWIHE